ncbi:MAG: toxin-antitoxin system HicB family antitoxin [Phormidesmis sp.]
MSETIKTDSKPVAKPTEDSSPEEYSGKALLTMPKTLHRKLAEAAKAEGVDLNQYIIAMLSEHSALQSVSSVQAKLDTVNQRLREREAVMRQMERRSREQRLSYDNRYVEDVDSGLND